MKCRTVERFAWYAVGLILLVLIHIKETPTVVYGTEIFREDQRNNGHKLHEYIKRRSAGVFHRIPLYKKKNEMKTQRVRHSVFMCLNSLCLGIEIFWESRKAEQLGRKLSRTDREIRGVKDMPSKPPRERKGKKVRKYLINPIK